MAATFIQTTGKVTSASGASVDSLAASFGSLPTVGRFILVQTFGWNSASNLDFITTACTDNQGNTYARAIQSPLQGGVRAAIFYCERVVTSAGTFTVTVNPGGASGPLVMVCTEWAGVFQGSLAQTASVQTGSGVNHASGTTAAAPGLVAAAMAITGGTPTSITVTPPAYDERAEELDNANLQAGECVTRVNAASVAQSCTWVLNASLQSAACIAVFTDRQAVLTTTQTWTWPTGVTSLTAEGLGGGGAGGAATGNPSTGGGGKGGSYAKVVVTKGAETTLTINVGAAGVAATGATGGSGGPSEVVQGGSTVLRGSGGVGGAVGSANSSNGAGATTVNGTAVGSTTFAGGNGGTGNFTSGVQGSGAGGGAAGSTSVGGAASVNTAGSVGTGAFANGTTYQVLGAAGVGNNLPGIAGGNYGGGGSGGKTVAVADQQGANGGAGIVVLTWTNAASTPPPLPGPKFYAEARRIT